MKRTWTPPRINLAGQQDILITVDFLAESRAGLDEFIADLMKVYEEKATTRKIQETHNVGIRDFNFRVIRWPERVSR